eukprot:jgi/Ulvmu1/11496/UM077_0045.1
MQLSTSFKSQCNGIDLTPTVLIGLAGIGLLRGLSVASSTVRFLWRKHLRPGRDLRAYGEWAVVTGASDGIGREYCNYVGRQGLNILLVSRTHSKVEKAAAEIREEHGVKTKTLAIDLAEAGAQSLAAPAWADLKAQVESLDVGVLINNAATIQRYPSDFHLVDADDVDSTMSLNDVAVLKLTRLILPGMVQRGRGAVVNVSSIVTTFPATPQLALYTASKAFLNTFSRALAAEYGSKGIHVQAQMPGPVATSLVRAVSPEGGFLPSPADFVRHAGRHIGYETVCIPYPYHAVATAVAQALPAGMVIAGFRGAMQDMRASTAAIDADQSSQAASGTACRDSAGSASGTSQQ